MLFMKVFASSGGSGGQRYRQLGSRQAQGPLQPGRTGLAQAGEARRSRATSNTRNPVNARVRQANGRMTATNVRNRAGENTVATANQRRRARTNTRTNS